MKLLMKYSLIIACILFLTTGCAEMQEWRAQGGLLGKMGYENSEQKLSKSWSGHTTDELITRWGKPTRIYQKDNFTVLQYKNVSEETTLYESPQLGYTQRTSVSHCTRSVYSQNGTISHINSNGNDC